jgi:hypothetical protein
MRQEKTGHNTHSCWIALWKKEMRKVEKKVMNAIAC